MITRPTKPTTSVGSGSTSSTAPTPIATKPPRIRARSPILSAKKPARKRPAVRPRMNSAPSIAARAGGAPRSATMYEADHTSAVLSREQ